MTSPTDDACSGSDCAEAATELFTYLDGALTSERRERIAHHLDDCSPCFDAFEFHAELKTVISQTCRTEVPEELRTRITQALASLTDADDGGPGL